MTSLKIQMEVRRILNAYPTLTNFMQGAWNEHCDRFPNFGAAVEWYMRLITEQMGKDFLEEVIQAATDQEFRNLMRDAKGSVDLAVGWGGMVLSDKRLAELQTEIQRCLDEGIYVSKQEEQRRAMRTRLQRQ